MTIHFKKRVGGYIINNLKKVVNIGGSMGWGQPGIYGQTELGGDRQEDTDRGGGIF